MYEKFYRSLYRIRRVEEEIARVYPTDKIKSPVHLSIGQESISVGVCEALAATDIVFGSYRCHAMYLAKGGDLNLTHPVDLLDFLHTNHWSTRRA